MTGLQCRKPHIAFNRRNNSYGETNSYISDVEAKIAGIIFALPSKVTILIEFCNISGWVVVDFERDDSQKASARLNIARIITDTRFNAFQFDDSISKQRLTPASLSQADLQVRILCE